MALDKNQIAQAISHFTSDKINGEAWESILLQAPAYAMERIAISMWHSLFGKEMSDEEKKAYRALREEIEATLEREDLEYLIKVMPKKQKEHYKGLLSLLPPVQEETQETIVTSEVANTQQPQKSEQETLVQQTAVA